MTVRIEIQRVTDLPAPLRAEIDSVGQDAYTVSGITRADPEWRLLVWHDHQWVTRLDIFPRMITVGAEPVSVGGIGGLLTRPEWRKKGYASIALNEATLYIRETLKADFGLLLCAPADVSFYIRSKWQIVAGPTHYIQPGGRQVVPPGALVTMIYSCTGDSWHSGPINLCGLPW